MNPIYKVISIDLRNMRNYVIFKSEDEQEARRFFDNEKVVSGKEKQLSVNYCGSETLIETK